MTPIFNSIRMSFVAPEENDTRVSGLHNFTLDDAFVKSGGFGKQYLN
jgi:hypothetical protein